MSKGIRLLTMTPAALAMLVMPAFSQDTDLEIASCVNAVGTYLTRRSIKVEGKPDMVMRSLVSLTNDGQVFFTDSSEGGVLDYQPFSDGRGVWKCLSADNGTLRLSALILDFTFPNKADPDAKIARLDIAAEIMQVSGEISGRTTIGFAPLDGNPLDRSQLTDPIEYTFTGIKVVMPD